MLHINKDKILFLESKDADPYFNMAADEYFFDQAENNNISGILRLYNWSPPGLSMGFFFKTAHFDLNRIKKDNIKIVRRITGGNAVLHRGDITYSIILNNKLLNDHSKKGFYYFVAGILQKALKKLNILSVINTKQKFKINDPDCYNSLSEYELASDQGIKLIGSAQKILRSSMLQHGSFFYEGDPSDINHYLKNSNSKNIKSMNILDADYDIIKNIFKDAFSEYFNFENVVLSDNILESIDNLVLNKYSKDDWNLKY